MLVSSSTCLYCSLGQTITVVVLSSCRWGQTGRQVALVIVHQEALKVQEQKVSCYISDNYSITGSLSSWWDLSKLMALHCIICNTEGTFLTVLGWWVFSRWISDPGGTFPVGSLMLVGLFLMDL